MDEASHEFGFCLWLGIFFWLYGEKFGINKEKGNLWGLEVFAIMPHETETEKLESLNDFSTCEDYLFDIASEDSINNLERDSNQGMKQKGSCCPADQDGYNGTPRRPGSSGTTNQVNDCQEDLHMNDSDRIFSCTAESEMVIEDRWFKYPTSFTVEHIDKLEDFSSMFHEDDKYMILNPGLSSGGAFCYSITKQENGHSSVGQNTNTGAIVGQDVLTCPREAIPSDTHADKRLHRPPQRFLDELLETDLKSIRRKGVSDTLPKGKSCEVTHKQRDISRKDRSYLDMGSYPSAICSFNMQ